MLVLPRGSNCAKGSQESLRVGEKWIRPCPFPVEAPGSSCLQLIIYNDLKDDGVSLSFQAGSLYRLPFFLVATGYLCRCVSRPWLHLLGSQIKYLSNLEIVFLAVLSLETEIKPAIRCRATAVD